jgi:hypothetical protein
MVAQTFRTSTPRVIGVELDVTKLRLRYWIDGKPLDDMVRKLPAGKSWIPTIHFTEKDLEVILNPFCVSSDEDFSSGLVPRGIRELHDDTKSGGQQSLAACLSRPIASLQSAFLAQEMSRYLIAYKFETRDSEGKDIPDKALIQQAKLLSCEEDRAALKQVESAEESKE